MNLSYIEIGSMGVLMKNFFLISKIHPLISPRSPILSVPKCRQTVSTTLLRSSNFDKFCEFFNYRLEPAFQWETWKVPLSPSLVYNVRTILEDSDLRLSLDDKMFEIHDHLRIIQFLVKLDPWTWILRKL